MNVFLHQKSSPRRVVLLAPTQVHIPAVFNSVECNPSLYRGLLADMQRFRGSIYVRDGAIQPWHLTADGRHESAADEKSWFILLMSSAGSVQGCVRFLLHENQVEFQDLEVRHSQLANCPTWGRQLRVAIEEELLQARHERLRYAELGGWALADEVRFTAEALRTTLATWALSQLLGGALGVSTATVRNHSSSILRRMGGQSFRSGDQEMPAYFDPQYGCVMELLRFRSSAPNPKYVQHIEQIRRELRQVPVVFNVPAHALWQTLHNVGYATSA